MKVWIESIDDQESEYYQFYKIAIKLTPTIQIDAPFYIDF